MIRCLISSSYSIFANDSVLSLAQKKPPTVERSSEKSQTPNIPYIQLRDLRWNWLRTSDEKSVKYLLNGVKPTQESILGDLNVKDVNTAISLARDRIEWKS